MSTVENTNTTTEPNSDFNVDNFMDNLDQPSSEIPMSVPRTNESVEPGGNIPSVDQNPTDAQQYEITVGGKVIKASLDNLKQWAQQGRDYAQKMQEFNSSKEALDTERTKFQEHYSTYQKIDEYAQQNPDWWEHTQNAFNQANGTPIESDNSDIAQLKNEINELREFKTKFESDQVAKQQEAEDSALDQDIKSTKDTYKYMDWDSPDPNTGKTREDMVIEHGVKIGTDSFLIAFRDLYHNDLLSRAEAQGKETVQKDLQARTKLGLLSTSSTPMKHEVVSTGDVRNKSYDDIESEINEELAAGVYSS